MGGYVGIHARSQRRGRIFVSSASACGLPTDANLRSAWGSNRSLWLSVVGSADDIRSTLQAIIHSTGADELMFSGDIFDQPARLRSFEIVASVMQSLNEGHLEKTIA